jgi:GntR family transcriptional regulator of arabinose operon
MKTNGVLSDMSILSMSHGKQYTPKYIDLARDLVRQIAHNGLVVGDRLGTEQELSNRYNLSRVTVRQALEVLEGEGYISRKRARGTFVAKEVESIDQIALNSGRVLLVCSNEQKSHSDEDSAFCTVFRSIEQALAQRHFAVQVMTVGQNPREDRQRLRALVMQGEMNAVLTIGPCLEPYSDLLADTTVVTSCSFYPTAFPWVGDDVALAAHHSVRHLLENGHRRIAMICGSWIDGAAFAAFANGYLAAMTEASMPVDRSLLVNSYPGESLELLVENVLSRNPAPTSVFCENWRVCRAVLNAAAKLGLSIPQDLSVVGYGQNVCEINSPVEISAYVPETAKVGEVAVDLLCGLVADKKLDEKAIMVPGRLVERSSVRRLSAGD